MNRTIYSPKGATIAEVDIEIGDVVIEVKSGNGSGLLKSMKDYGGVTDRERIADVAGLGKEAAKNMKNAGIRVFRSLDDLAAYLSGLPGMQQ